jgi:hypothetical protein
MEKRLERFVTAQYYAIQDLEEAKDFPSMTLFALAKPECEVFQKVLDKFFHGERDQRTIEILKKEDGSRFETKS